MGPRDSCFEMQIVTYAHCPSHALPPIDRLKQILLIIEYLMAIIKSLIEVLTPHFQFPSSYSRGLCHGSSWIVQCNSVTASETSALTIFLSTVWVPSQRYKRAFNM